MPWYSSSGIQNDQKHDFHCSNQSAGELILISLYYVIIIIGNHFKGTSLKIRDK